MFLFKYCSLYSVKYIYIRKERSKKISVKILSRIFYYFYDKNRYCNNFFYFSSINILAACSNLQTSKSTNLSISTEKFVILNSTLNCLSRNFFFLVFYVTTHFSYQYRERLVILKKSTKSYFPSFVSYFSFHIFFSVLFIFIFFSLIIFNPSKVTFQIVSKVNQRVVKSNTARTDYRRSFLK